MGTFEEGTEGLIFKGREFPVPPQQKEAAAGPTDKATEPEVSSGSTDRKAESKAETRAYIGQSICDKRFTEGRISVEIEFARVDYDSVAEIVLQYDPASEDMLTVGFGGRWDAFFSLRQWGVAEEGAGGSSRHTQGKIRNWKYLRNGGDRSNLQANKRYSLEVVVAGSLLTLRINGVDVGSETLPFQLTGLQVGLFCIGRGDIHFRNFHVESVKPQAFVVMQFNSPEYEELFTDVIQPVCNRVGLQAFRASDTYAPGLIVADIARQIAESRVIIAEITPVNANVYYEVGYADALKKPVILIADRKVKELPFDVRPYRTIFYENSIGGKAKVEETLVKFLTSIMAYNT